MDLPGVRSVAAVVTYEGVTYWAAAASLPGRAGWGNDQPAIRGRTFEEWVREQVVLRGLHMRETGAYVPGWVALDETGVLTAHRGARIIEQTTPARPDQAPPGVPSAQAVIEVRGATLCVIARMLPGDPADIIYLAESEHQGCVQTTPGVDYPGIGAAGR